LAPAPLAYPTLIAAISDAVTPVARASVVACSGDLRGAVEETAELGL
jgi:hypothetical protein